MLNPIDLFDSYDKSDMTIKSLRKAQHEILDIYYSKLVDNPRIGIKLPTGSGKSLIAILLLEAMRKDGKVAAIVTANKALAQDIKKRCDVFGIPSATIFGVERGITGSSSHNVMRKMNLLRYKQKQIIGIFNYHSFLYGTEYNQEIYPPDILVLDDASDFTVVRNDFFNVVISRTRNEKIYKIILEALIEKTRLYANLGNFIGKTARQSDVELVYFIHNDLVLSLVQQHLKSLMANDSNFKFAYRRNFNKLNSLLIFISQFEIEFRPLLIPEELLSMGNIKQIIFMSATLPDEELLNKMFGIRKNPVFIIDETSITKEAFEELTTLGKRLIFPLDQTDLRHGVGDKCKKIIFDLVKVHKKLLILANSIYDAECLNKYLIAKGIETRLFTTKNYEYFSKRMNQGVLICANRYFGLDFPGKTCEVAVIVRLPRIWDNVDAFQYGILNNSDYVDQTSGYRLTQSLGRCNRLMEDEALYYILDSRILARITGISKYLRFLPRNMFAELLTGYALSEGGIFEKAIQYGSKLFFNVNDPLYSKLLKETINNWKPEQYHQYISKYDLEIEAWQKSITQSYSSAGTLFDYVASDYCNNAPMFEENNLDILAAFNYYLSAFNYYNAFIHYKDDNDKNKALESLKKSIDVGGSVSWFNNLRSVYNQISKYEKLKFDMSRIEIRKIKETIAMNFDDFISANSTTDRNWKKAYQSIITLINEGKHGQSLNALVKIFEILEYVAYKGDNIKGEPDLIIKTPKYQVSIEIKTKREGEIESVKSVTQSMGGSNVLEQITTQLPTYAAVITQKDQFSQTAIKVAKGKVKLISTSVFSKILNKINEKIAVWNDLTASKKTTFIDSIISPFDLEVIFKPSDNPILSPSDIPSF